MPGDGDRKPVKDGDDAQQAKNKTKQKTGVEDDEQVCVWGGGGIKEETGGQRTKGRLFNNDRERRICHFQCKMRNKYVN